MASCTSFFYITEAVVEIVKRTDFHTLGMFMPVMTVVSSMHLPMWPLYFCLLLFLFMGLLSVIGVFRVEPLTQ